MSDPIICEEISREDIEKMGAYLEGTCTSILMACDALDLPEDPDWEDKLLDVSIERCRRCEHWFESCMLEFIESDDGGSCDDCLTDEEKEEFGKV
jgi:hypothetical protein